MDDKIWKTCRDCNLFDDGTLKGNWVIDSLCRECRKKRDVAYLFNQAKENGKVTCDDKIMCPYCGYINEYDCYENNNDKTFTCPECDEESDLDVEYTTHYTTRKRGDSIE